MSTASNFKARWQLMGFRERVLVSLCALVVGAALIWWVGIAPALKSLREAQVAAVQLDAQLATMRAQAAEAASLKGQRSVSPEESQRMLETSVKQTLGTGAQLVTSDGRASLSLKGVSADALAQWLQQARSNARALPAELRLQKSNAVSTATSTATAWDGTVIMSLPKSP